MSKIFLTLSILITAAAFANAQDSTVINVKADSTIKASTVRHGKYYSTLYSVNGEPITQASLEARLMSYDGPALELQQYKSIRRSSHITGFVFASVSIGAIIAAGIQANQSNAAGTLFSKAPVFCSISIACLIGEFISLGWRNDHFEKAINAYNNQVEQQGR